MGFKVGSIVRLWNPYDTVAATSENSEEGKKISEVDRLGGFRVRVESKRKPATPQQCYLTLLEVAKKLNVGGRRLAS